MPHDDVDTAQACFIAPSASITGKVSLGRDASIWHNVTLRGDLAPVEVGDRSNIQDGAILHVATNLPCIIGDDVTIGHGAIVHGCKVGNRCLIGMGSIILNGAEIGDECIIGAGALVTEGKKIPPRSLVVGSPARVTRQISETELKHVLENAASYCKLASKARTDSTTTDC